MGTDSRGADAKTATGETTEGVATVATDGTLEAATTTIAAAERGYDAEGTPSVATLAPIPATLKGIVDAEKKTDRKHERAETADESLRKTHR